MKFQLTFYIFIGILFSLFSCKSPKEHEAVSVPYDFSSVSTHAKSGEWVLAPPFEFLQTAREKGIDSARFIFYQRKCIMPDKTETLLLELSDTVVMPNSLFIPIPAGATAKKGDIILTWWQSGSGMQRAIVVDDSVPESPSVKYLDIDFDNPVTNEHGIPVGQMTEKILPNTFIVLEKEWQAGTTVVYDDYGIYVSYQIISIADEKILAVSWTGKLLIINKSECIAIPIKQDIEVNDRVQVLYIGSYTNGIVQKYDEISGRATIEVEFAGEKDTIVASVGDITKGLDIYEI